jgi:hypothetical protein
MLADIFPGLGGCCHLAAPSPTTKNDFLCRLYASPLDQLTVLADYEAQGRSRIEKPTLLVERYVCI